MGRGRPDARGSILIVAVVAMLVLGILGVSFALLARIESGISLDHTQQAQAEALAEGALERAQDALRGAAAAPDGFTAWLNTGLWGGAPQSPPAYAGDGAYWYRARVDNDCAGLGTAPASVEDAVPCAAASTANAVDGNGTAIVTAWAHAGTGRARVRAVVAVDDPWQHVCSGFRADATGLCQAGSDARSGLSLRPSSPKDPHGPAVWDDLPRPRMGCSRIDPTLHATQAGCAAYPGMYEAPYPTDPGSPRFVVMGPDPAAVPGAPTCNPTGQRAYFGYFDCALATACDGTVTSCNGGIRKGCLAADDPTDIAVPPYAGRYVKVQQDALGQVTSGCVAQGGTGMVFLGDLPDADWGSPDQRFTYYLLRGTASLRDHAVYGTLVVEGDGSGGDDLSVQSRARLVTGPDASVGTGGWGPAQYGYPLAVLLWDPDASGSPQATVAALGRPGDALADRADVRGYVHAGGQVRLAAITLTGGILAWVMEPSATDASMAFDALYGGAAPPGFSRAGVATVVRRTVLACASYHDEAAGATPCP